MSQLLQLLAQGFAEVGVVIDQQDLRHARSPVSVVQVRIMQPWRDCKRGAKMPLQRYQEGGFSA
jgi:hypothetical protein